jgi:hypothetical protein
MLLSRECGHTDNAVRPIVEVSRLVLQNRGAPPAQFAPTDGGTMPLSLTQSITPARQAPIHARSRVRTPRTKARPLVARNKRESGVMPHVNSPCESWAGKFDRTRRGGAGRRRIID